MSPTTVGQWYNHAQHQLQSATITTARLDAQLLLSDELQRDKAWILAHPEHILSSTQLSSLDKKLARRCKYEPMAYIRSVQEFFGRPFLVTSDVLIPRPETELLIEAALATTPATTLLDVGTGSGAIAITLALELPKTTVMASDISQSALAIAHLNAERLHATVNFACHDLLTNEQRGPFDMIVANLPYVDRTWQRSPETNYEPPSALFAEAQGLQLITQLLTQAPAYLTPNGHILLEADPTQHHQIIAHGTEYGFKLTFQKDFLVGLQLIAEDKVQA